MLEQSHSQVIVVFHGSFLTGASFSNKMLYSRAETNLHMKAASENSNTNVYNPYKWHLAEIQNHESCVQYNILPE